MRRRIQSDLPIISLRFVGSSEVFFNNLGTQFRSTSLSKYAWDAVEKKSMIIYNKLRIVRISKFCEYCHMVFTQKMKSIYSFFKKNTLTVNKLSNYFQNYTYFEWLFWIFNDWIDIEWFSSSRAGLPPENTEYNDLYLPTGLGEKAEIRMASWDSEAHKKRSKLERSK